MSPAGQVARLHLMLEPVLLISHALAPRAHGVAPLEVSHQLTASGSLLHAPLHPRHHA